MANKDWNIERFDLPNPELRNFEFSPILHVTGYGEACQEKWKTGEYGSSNIINFKDGNDNHRFFLHIEQLQALFNHLVAIGAIDVPMSPNAALVEAANNAIILQQPIHVTDEKIGNTTQLPSTGENMDGGNNRQLLSYAVQLNELGETRFESIAYKEACRGMNIGMAVIQYTRLQLMITEHPIPVTHGDVALYQDYYNTLVGWGLITKVFITSPVKGYGVGPCNYYAATERGYRVWSCNNRNIPNCNI